MTPIAGEEDEEQRNKRKKSSVVDSDAVYPPPGRNKHKQTQQNKDTENNHKGVKIPTSHTTYARPRVITLNLLVMLKKTAILSCT